MKVEGDFMYTAVPLPYAYDALEPYIDTRTVGLHYEKHYHNYLNKLNALLKKNNYKNEYSKEELVQHIEMFPIGDRGDILYNLGGVLNHELYFSNMSPKKANQPVQSILKAINAQYGDYENFKQQFLKEASYLVGSGYTFLVVNRHQELEIINLSNQETPLTYGLTPLIALDLWEHAYYLNYQNERERYMKNFFEIINFEQINTLYEETIAQKS